MIEGLQALRPTIREFTGSVKNLLAAGTNRDNVRRLQRQIGSRSSPEDYLVDFYKRSSPLLRSMQAEIDTFVTHMQALTALQERQSLLAIETERRLGDLLTYARMDGSPRGVDAFRIEVKNTPAGQLGPLVSQFSSALHTRIQNATASNIPLPTVNLERSQLNNLLSPYSSLHRLWTQLDLDRRDYLHTQVRYLCRLPDPPGASATVEQQWQQKAHTAAVAMRRAELEFHRARLGAPPQSLRPTTCTRAPELIANDPL